MAKCNKTVKNEETMNKNEANLKYILLIPAYNPDETFVTFMKDIRSTGIVAVVVDDGSKKECAEYFTAVENAGFKIIHQPHNMGKGAALRTGFKYIKDEIDAGRMDYTTVITADCDGQHTLKAIEDVATAAGENPDALIIGGRFQDQHDVPFKSKLGNGATRAIFKIATGLSIHDTQTGLRAIPVSSIPEMLTLKGDRYEYEMNMLLYLKQWSMPYVEIPIETVYFNNNEGSHYNPLRDSWLIFKQIIVFSAAGIISFLVDYVLYAILCLVAPVLFAGHDVNSDRIGGILSGSIIVGGSYLIARVVSGIVNYVLNSRVTFKTRGKGCFARYFVLWLGILLLGAGSSWLISNFLMWPELVCKILVDAPLFVLSFIGQREFVFKKRKRK